MLKQLLVADNDSYRSGMLHDIFKQNFEVMIAADFETALSLIRNKLSFAAILIDNDLFNSNEAQMIEMIDYSNQFSPTPVIFITDDVNDEQRSKLFKTGAIGIITRPYSPDIILNQINNIVELYHGVSESTKDELTGLYNRKLFFKVAEKLIKSHKPGFYVMSCFDIDSFKVINDQYGAKKGDQLLKNIAKIFRNYFIPIGGLCCRVMADHFAILYPYSFSKSDKISEIHELLSRADKSILPISFSVGRYIINDLSLSMNSIYDRAAIAKSSIKSGYGIRTVEYKESMRAQILMEQEITSEMKIALQENQFEIWLQPQYNHSSGALLGAEALVRWRHPQKGIISPGSFIPVFERNGFIYELDKYIWEQSCILLHKWLTKDISPLPISVNISRNDVFSDDIIDVFSGLINKYEIPVDLLHLEITESAFAKSSEQIIRVVKKFISLGFTVEIDDFGSGYSSLNTLKDVPAQVVKLDMRFLEGSDNSERGGNILESIVRMTKWLGVSVIAEGVETVEQADYLKSIGCVNIQGYFYAKPMPVDEYEKISRTVIKEESLFVLDIVENLNNNSFWNANSLDTLIFNSYIGAACILEYHDNKVELLRANKKYTKSLGEKLTIETAFKIKWGDYLDEINHALIMNAFEKAIKTKNEITGEYMFSNLPGCLPKVYVRSTIRLLASAGSRFLFYCTNENITAQREAEQKKNIVTERLQVILSNINSSILAVSVEKNNKMNIIFANDQYYKNTGYTKEQFETNFSNIFEPILYDDRSFVIEAINEACRIKSESTIEYRIMRQDKKIIWVRTFLSFTKFNGIDFPVLLGVITDITETKNVEKKQQSIYKHLQFLNNTAADLISCSDTSVEINNILQKVHDYFDCDRVYLFENDPCNSSASCSFYINSDDIFPYTKEQFSQIISSAGHWPKFLKHSKFYLVKNIDLFKKTRPDEYKICKKLSIRSIMAIPIFLNNIIIGTITLFNPRKHLAYLENLAALGNHLAVILTHQRLNNELAEKNKLSDSPDMAKKNN